MENISTQLYRFIIFFIISFLFQLIVIKKLKKSFLDNPNSRSLHNTPIPTGGGIVFVIIGTLGSLYFKYLLPLICIPLSITGLIDDRLNISRGIRYFIQLLTALVLINLSSLNINTGNYTLNIFLQLILIISITAIINFVNFMDGIDGLVAGSMIVYFLIFTLTITPALLPLLSSLSVFLIFNWHPAKVFMGDVGSTYLGALFSGLLLQMPNWTLSLESLLVASPLLADALICIMRRLLNKENIFKPHRKHLYQRLIGQKGLTHSKVSIIYISASILCSLSMYLGGFYSLILTLIFLLMIGFYLDKFIAKSFIKKII